MYSVFAIIDDESVIGFSQLKIISSSFFFCGRYFKLAILNLKNLKTDSLQRLQNPLSTYSYQYDMFFFRLSHCHLESTILNDENLITDS